MEMQTGYETEKWEDYFIKAGISADSAKSYAAMFPREKLMKENLQTMDRAMLKELGITAMGEALSILKQAKEVSKAPSAKLPQHHFEMTPYPTIQKISNQLGIVHLNDRHTNFSNQHTIMVWLVLWHKNPCKPFNAKLCLYTY